MLPYIAAPWILWEPSFLNNSPISLIAKDPTTPLHSYNWWDWTIKDPLLFSWLSRQFRRKICEPPTYSNFMLRPFRFRPQWNSADGWRIHDEVRYGPLILGHDQVPQCYSETDGNRWKDGKSLTEHTSPMISNDIWKNAFCLLTIVDSIQWYRDIAIGESNSHHSSDVVGSVLIRVRPWVPGHPMFELLSAVWILCAWHESLSHAATKFCCFCSIMMGFGPRMMGSAEKRGSFQPTLGNPCGMTGLTLRNPTKKVVFHPRTFLGSRSRS